jgi:isopentenyl diphosphate isomerase/L-lactate dehydrogenase-like FMN-dependent dehydrogenase
MWDLINEYANYIKVGLVVLAACICFYGGFHIGNNRYLEYKARVESAAKEQEEKNKSVEAQQALITKGIINEYEAKLAAVRNFYSIGVRNTGGRTMSGISPTPKGTDAETAYPILAEQCARTTAQLTSLQDWVNEQVGIK